MRISNLGRRAAAIVSAAVVLAPVAAYAGPNLQVEFAAMDANADGYVSGVEYKPTGEPVLPDPGIDPRSIKGPDSINMYAPDGSFLRLRIVRDGEPNLPAPGEVLLTPGQLRQYSLNRLDVDGDERLSFTEYRAMRIRGARFIFDRSDADFDERLTLKEFVAQAAPLPSASLYAQYTEEMKASVERGRKAALERAEVRFRTFDANGDGFVTRDEMVPT